MSPQPDIAKFHAREAVAATPQEATLSAVDGRSYSRWLAVVCAVWPQERGRHFDWCLKGTVRNGRFSCAIFWLAWSPIATAGRMLSHLACLRCAPYCYQLLIRAPLARTPHWDRATSRCRIAVFSMPGPVDVRGARPDRLPDRPGRLPRRTTVRKRGATMRNQLTPRIGAKRSRRVRG